MNRIDSLIKEFCPNGVKFYSIEQCCTILDRKRKPITKSARKPGKYPYYGANGIQDYVDDYIFEGRYVLVGEDGSVITPSGNPVVNWAEGKIWVNNHAHIIEEKEGVMLRFIFHYLHTINITPLIHGNIPKLTGKDFKSIRIPVPPLNVQREIVDLIDELFILEADLMKKISEEINSRRKQHNYYKNMLLTFDNDTERIPMGDLFEFRNGLSKGKAFFGKGVPFIRYTDVYNKRALKAKDISEYVECTESEIEKLCVKRGDVFFTRTSETAEDIGWSSVFLDDMDKCVFNGFSIKATPKTDKLLPEYCAYCFTTEEFRNFVSTNCAFTTRASLTGSAISKYELPVPPLEIQRKLVEVLRCLEESYEKLNEALPTEIDNRNGQYEYYRNKLMTFKEAV